VTVSATAPCSISASLQGCAYRNWSVCRELLGDLCELVWSHYQLPLQDIIREQRQAFPPAGGATPEDDDPAF